MPRGLPQRLAQAGLDALAWLTAIVVASWMRYDFTWSAVNHHAVLYVGVAAGLLQVICGATLRVYQGRYLYGSFDQVLALAVATGITTTLVTGMVAFRTEHWVPVGALLVAGATALLWMLTIRYLVRSWRDRRRRPGENAVPVVVYGAGDAGIQLVRGIQRDPHSRYRVVGIIDDNPGKRRLHLFGIPVRPGAELESVAHKQRAEILIMSIADPGPRFIADVSRRASDIGLSVKTIPTLTEMVEGRVGPDDVRDLDVTDLLRRRPIAIDLTQVKALLRGKRVLITGAGGSIGAELSRQVQALGTASAIGLLDRDESALHGLQLSMSGRALLDDDSTILADIRDLDRMHEVMQEFRPDVVFHAAALKHLPLLERYPQEALLSNVWGTQHVLDAARAAAVTLFVNISTDKAADPDCVLGYTKRITERLTSSAGRDGSTYVSVRFGNVLGSRGSVLTTFESQIRSGGPVTVTHREVTRYFMTIPEAVQLVLQSAAVGTNGDVLVLDMGHPVRIADVARQLIEHSGRSIDIVYTGLRDGEKMAEVLYGSQEEPQPTSHPLISRVSAPRLSPDSLDALNHGTRGPALIQAMELLSMPTRERICDDVAVLSVDVREP